MKFDVTLMKQVKMMLEANCIPMLLGEPGIGKSSWIEALAAELHTKCFTLACNQLADKADLTGARMVPVTDANGVVIRHKQAFFPHSVIDEAIDYAEKNPRETPILFMDELNRTTPDVTSEALSIPTARRIGDAKLPKNLRVIIAGNDKGNITALDEASVSRFVLIHVNPDVNTFLSLDPNLNEFVKKTLTQHPETIFGKKVISVPMKDDDDDTAQGIIEDIFDEGDEMAQIATPRTIMALSRYLNILMANGTQEINLLLANVYMNENGESTNALMEIIEGFTGKTCFSGELLKIIAADLQTMQSGVAATHNVPKPACYDDLKNCPDMTAMNALVGSLSARDKSGCLVYALWEKQDNADVIIALAPQIAALEPDDTKQLMTLRMNEELDQANVTAFLQGQSTISKNLAIILNQ